jgi:hypothetical protein
MKRNLLFIVVSIFLNGFVNAQTTFSITIERTKNIGDSLVTGIISVNGEPIGKTYENKDSLVKADKYRGLMRYYSQRGFVTGPFGTIGNVGDFLLEIDSAYSQTGRIKTNVLFHTGFLPKHSKGCILLGAVNGPPSARFISDDHTLRKLRQKFYGTDTPNSCPNVKIEIEIIDSY